MAQHLAAVADAFKGTDRDVGSVGDEAEPGEETHDIVARHPECGGAQPTEKRQQYADQRTGPHHH